LRVSSEIAAPLFHQTQVCLSCHVST